MNYRSNLSEIAVRPRAYTSLQPAPVLLTTGGYLGTLAAVRALGRAGIPVIMADNDALSVSRWSRFLHSRVRAPDVRAKRDRFLEWLCAFGKKSKVRHVLLPTCDDTAWLYAQHRDTLSRHFHLSTCGVDAVYALLNKRRLMAACEEVGIAVPETRSLASDADLLRIAREAQFPLLIKPSTQVFFESRHKGTVVTEPATFVDTYRRFSELIHASPLLAFDASVRWPLVQDYIATAERNIYNLSGYIGRDGKDCVLRASVKVLQERAIGVGICFERAEIQPALADSVRALFSRLGYHGIFEIEFIPAHGRYYLIDANPRFYGELAFDVARSMPLPLIAYFDAVGDAKAVRALIDSARERDDAPRAHTYRFGLGMFLGAQRLSGALSPQQHRHWKNWRAKQGTQLSDAVHDEEDWLPSLVEATNCVYRQLRFPAELFEQTARHRLACLRQWRT